MQLNIFIFILVAALTFWATVSWQDRTGPVVTQAPQNPEHALGADQTAPDFSFTTPDGKQYRLSDFSGKVIVLNFWASWCPPCVKEFPILLDIAAQFPDQAVLIALSSDLDAAAMERFLQKQKKPGENVYIALDENQSITQKLYQTYSLPETLIITPQLQLHSKLVGADWEAESLSKTITTLSNAQK
jgi:thiol-disulfide isomerase/thioredoxin